MLIVLKRWGIGYFILLVMRVLFYSIHVDSFGNESWTSILSCFLYAFYFDTTTLCCAFALTTFLSLLPTRWQLQTWYSSLLFFTYLLPIIGIIIVEIIDIFYFSYTKQRSTVELFTTITGNDSWQLVPTFLKYYWYLFLVFPVSIYFVIKFYPKDKDKQLAYWLIATKIKSCFLLLFTAGILVIGIRGGVQLRPSTMLTANQLVAMSLVPLVVNTPFCMLRSIGKKEMERYHYTNTIPYAAFQKVDTLKSAVPIPNKKQKNVVVIIVESLSREHIGCVNTHLPGYVSYMPFLDSLIKNSYFWDNGMANGTRSIEGIPAILSSTPSLNNTAYISSLYNINSINSIASLLNEEGYHSSFYHAAEKGTMGFDGYTSIAGFQEYVSKSEYQGKKEDDDESWGIYDHAFLPWYAKQLTTTNKYPFVSTVFTLSSHHPYKIPANIRPILPPTDSPLRAGMAYADYSLKCFFEEARKQPWFDNTVFMITGDHTSCICLVDYMCLKGEYRIPFLLYDPSNAALKGQNSMIIQQIDVLPTLLHYVQYKKPFYSLGRSMLDTTASNKRFAIGYKNDHFHLFMDNHILFFNGKEAQGMYNTLEDSGFKDDLLLKDSTRTRYMTHTIKSFLQRYSTDLIDNKTIYKK